ncbi:MAG: hypothetical protein Q9213_000712 [Squamulea squamosa]
MNSGNVLTDQMDTLHAGAYPQPEFSQRQSHQQYNDFLNEAQQYYRRPNPEVPVFVQEIGIVAVGDTREVSLSNDHGCTPAIASPTTTVFLKARKWNKTCYYWTLDMLTERYIVKSFGRNTEGRVSYRQWLGVRRDFGHSSAAFEPSQLEIPGAGHGKRKRSVTIPNSLQKPVGPRTRLAAKLSSPCGSLEPATKQKFESTRATSIRSSFNQGLTQTSGIGSSVHAALQSRPLVIVPALDGILQTELKELEVCCIPDDKMERRITHPDIRRAKKASSESSKFV